MTALVPFCIFTTMLMSILLDLQNQASFDTWTSLFLVAALQGFFLSLVLFRHKKGNLLANHILSLLIGLYSITLVSYVIYWTGYYKVYTWMDGWTDSFPLIFGPLTYFYVKVLEDGTLPRNYKRHFIPVWLSLIYLVPVLIKNTFGSPDWIMPLFGNMRHWLWFFRAVVVAQNISLITYGVILLQDLKKYAPSDSSDQAEAVKKSWLKKVILAYNGFVWGYLLYWVLVWTDMIRVEYDYTISFAISVFIYMTGYLGFRQPEIFNGVEQQKKEAEAKYSRSTLKPEQLILLKERLIQLMEEKKPFLNSELKIQQLSEMMGISSHQLSQLVNEQLGLSYPEFIHKYRIREAERLLSDPNYAETKILSIAFDVGYSNKATFNSAFKKLTGMSPLEFKRAQSRQTLRVVRTGTDLFL